MGVHSRIGEFRREPITCALQSPECCGVTGQEGFSKEGSYELWASKPGQKEGMEKEGILGEGLVFLSSTMKNLLYARLQVQLLGYDGEQVKHKRVG